MVAYCHYRTSVVTKFLARAQDRGMTDGEYAFHTFAEYATQAVLQPWSAWSTLNISDWDYRKQAFYAVNLVSLMVFRFIVTSNGLAVTYMVYHVA